MQAYGPFAAHMDLDRMVTMAHKPTQDRAKFRRYFLNLPVSPVRDVAVQAPVGAVRAAAGGPPR
jgi:hypothetical protein